MKSTFKDGERVIAKFSVSRWKEVKPSLKYRLIDKCVGKYSIEKMCNFYGVSRSGYYRYQQHKDIPAKDVPLPRQLQSARVSVERYTVSAIFICGLKRKRVSTEILRPYFAS